MGTGPEAQARPRVWKAAVNRLPSSRFAARRARDLGHPIRLGLSRASPAVRIVSPESTRPGRVGVVNTTSRCRYFTGRYLFRYPSLAPVPATSLTARHGWTAGTAVFAAVRTMLCGPCPPLWRALSPVPAPLPPWVLFMLMLTSAVRCDVPGQIILHSKRPSYGQVFPGGVMLSSHPMQMLPHVGAAARCPSLRGDKGPLR